MKLLAQLFICLIQTPLLVIGFIIGFLFAGLYGGFYAAIEWIPKFLDRSGKHFKVRP